MLVKDGAIVTEGQTALRLLALAGMFYCAVRILTTVLNALRVVEARALVDVLTVVAVWLVAIALAVTIYYWLRLEPYDRLET